MSNEQLIRIVFTQYDSPSLSRFQCSLVSHFFLSVHSLLFFAFRFVWNVILKYKIEWKTRFHFVQFLFVCVCAFFPVSLRVYRLQNASRTQFLPLLLFSTIFRIIDAFVSAYWAVKLENRKCIKCKIAENTHTCERVCALSLFRCANAIFLSIYLRVSVLWVSVCCAAFFCFAEFRCNEQQRARHVCAAQWCSHKWMAVQMRQHSLFQQYPISLASALLNSYFMLCN